MEALLKQGMLVIKTQRTHVLLPPQLFEVCFAVSGFKPSPQNSNITHHNQEQDGSL
jgi:hypothetical protein